MNITLVSAVCRNRIAVSRTPIHFYASVVMLYSADIAMDKPHCICSTLSIHPALAVQLSMSHILLRMVTPILKYIEIGTPFFQVTTRFCKLGRILHPSRKGELRSSWQLEEARGQTAGTGVVCQPIRWMAPGALTFKFMSEM